jgi:2-keto-4-pentenoate hydratase
MNAFPGDATAAFLAAHFPDRTKATPTLPGPATRAEAYRIQDRVMSVLGDACGWKVGRAGSNPEPYCAPLPAARLLGSGGVYARHDGLARLEAELGLRIGRDVPAGSVPGVAECAELVDAIVPAIEILEGRLAGPQAEDALWKLADLQGNGGLVLGAPVPWSGQDLRQVSLALSEDGEPGAVAHPFGNPFDLFCWTVDHVSRHRGGLRRGNVVITGSYCGVVALADAQRFTATFPEYGVVSVDVV